MYTVYNQYAQYTHIYTVFKEIVFNLNGFITKLKLQTDIIERYEYRTNYKRIVYLAITGWV